MKTKLQQWIAFMRKTSPMPVPDKSYSGKVLIVDSDGNPSWGTVQTGGIPLGDGEGIAVFKDSATE